MTVVDKVSIAVAVLNGLTLAVMTVALLLQARAIHHSQKDTLLALLALRSQSLATLITYLDGRMSQLNPKDGLQTQKERTDLEATLRAQVGQLNSILDRIDHIEKGA